VNVGDKFFGNFSIDTKLLSSEGAGDAGETLGPTSFVLPGQDYTGKLQGNGHLYTAFPEGNTQIFGGSQSNDRLELDVATGIGEVFDTKSLFGKSGRFSYGIYENGGFFIRGSATIAPISSVPEATTWGMMIIGLGLAGAAARRRRQTVMARVATSHRPTIDMFLTNSGYLLGEVRGSQLTVRKV
jgi:hypothetical protein